MTIKDAAQQLLQVLQKMGEQHTNPVLDLLGPTPRIIENQKYPDEYLRFGCESWRAYYHCHAAPNKLENEYGHFHIFVRLSDANQESEKWSHVTALAMDSMGQPLCWFTVNHWVTGQTWASANNLNPLLTKLPSASDATLAEHWLMAMLKFYRSFISKLLQERDSRLNQLQQPASDENILMDHNVYELSRQPIHLLKELEQALTYDV